MSKALLVALREYMENLKTKTFWIGIMVFPVILIASFLVPTLFKKDVRQYAVIDRSKDKILKFIDQRAALPDLEQVFLTVKEIHEKGEDQVKELPEVLRKMAPFVAQLDEEQIKEAAAQFAELFGPEGEALIEKAKSQSPGSVPDEITVEDVRAKTGEFLEPIKEWWEEVKPKEVKKVAPGLSKSRYVRIDVDARGGDPEARLKRMVNEGGLFAYFVIGEDPVESSEGCKYVSNNLTDTDLKSWFSRFASEEVRARRIAEVKISEEVAKKIQEPVRFESKQVSEAGEEEKVEAEDKARQWAPVVFVYLLWISVFVVAQMLLTNTIEEKSNKIMEVLLSSVSPMQLMAGKIVGIAGTGLTMVLSWVIFFFACLKIMPYILKEMPDIDFALIARDPIYIGSFVAYFILGYLLLAAILVGIGSVCNSLKEAQNLMSPVTIILIIPLLAMVPIGEDPNGAMAKVMSYIPPFTPFVMMNRAAGPPSNMEYLVTTILLLASIAFALWAAAKIFRVGILMTGKPPKPLEILKWIGAPVGHVQVRKEE